MFLLRVFVFFCGFLALVCFLFCGFGLGTQQWAMYRSESPSFVARYSTALHANLLIQSPASTNLLNDLAKAMKALDGKKTLPDSWPLAKITIKKKSSSQWMSKMLCLFFADEYARRTVGIPRASQVPDMELVLQAVQNVLSKLETLWRPVFASLIFLVFKVQKTDPSF